MLVTSPARPMWRSQPQQQNKTGPIPAAPPAAPGTPGTQPPAAPPAAPPVAPPAPPAPADQALGEPGLRALQAERDANATLRAEIQTLRAAQPPAPPAPPGTPAPGTPSSNDEVATLRTELAQMRSESALNAAGIRYQLPAATLAIVGTYGSPEQITERARLLAEHLAGTGGATPPPPPPPPGGTPPAPPVTPGLPPSPNAGGGAPPAAATVGDTKSRMERALGRRPAVTPTT